MPGDAFRSGCEESIRRSIEEFPDNSSDCCIERASLIANAMCHKSDMNCFAICKRDPGGFDQWAFQVHKVAGRDHFFKEWRETSPGLFGIGATRHCFVVQLY